MEDNKQLKAINHGTGPALVLAGPGSGKTRVLTHHVYSLIKRGVPPDKILVITFTKSAAVEMYDRFKKLSPSSANKVFFGTFHSFFYRMIRFITNNSKTIISETDKQQILLKILGSKDKAELFSNKISVYKSLIEKEAFSFDAIEKDEFLKVYDDYNALLTQNNKIDFDDITDIFFKLTEDRNNLNKVRTLFEYVCIDEFQDINMLQYECIKRIFEKKPNIFCVGDEDQSIYGFRGANAEIMRRFVSDFKDTDVIELETNYRCEKRIVDAAGKLISKNRNRLKSNIQTCVNSEDMSAFLISVSSSRLSQNRQLYEDVSKCLNEGLDCAILLRTNFEVLEFEELISSGLCKEKEKSVALELINDHLNYLMYAKTLDIGFLKPVINKPNRFIPSSVFSLGETNLDKLSKQFYGTYKADVFSVLSRQIMLLSKFSSLSFLMYLRNIVGYGNYIYEKFNDYKDILDVWYERIERLASTYPDTSMFIDELNKLKEEVGEKDSVIEFSNKPTITTYHKSKGLEFDCVFIPDVIKGKVPPDISEATCNLEEERRMFYVAMTRAKKKLKIYTIKDERSACLLPSSFLDDFLN